MKKAIFIFFIGILIFLGVYVLVNKIANKETSQAANKPGLATANKQPPASQAENGYQLQLDSQASVEVEITPKALGASEEKNIFAVALNTHSVELDFDFTSIISLKDDLGKEYEALEWTGNRGWHHVSGDIIFPKLDTSAKRVELIVVGVGGVDRKFAWELK